MATPPSDDTRTMFRILSDGDWHNYQVVKSAIAMTVPPGRALRKYQERLRQNRDLRQDANTDIYRSEDEQIRLGSMACAQITMTSWKGKGVIVRGEGLEKEIKIKPGFHAWGIESTPVTESQDPPSKAPGYTDVPASGSEPSEAPSRGREEASESPPAPPPAETSPIESVPVTELPADNVFLDPGPGPEGPEPSRFVTNVPVQICPECAMAVTDLPEHERWHAELKAHHGAKELALVDREMLVTLVRDVTRQVLDEFQVGMQDWFEQRFAEVERQIQALRGARFDRSSWTRK